MRVPRWDAIALALALLGPSFAICLMVLAALRLTSSRGPPLSPVAAVRERGPRFLLLLVAAAAIESSLDRLPATPLGVLGVAIAVAVAARLDEAGAVLIAAAVLHQGFAPLAVLAGLAIGPIALDWKRIALSAAVVAAATRVVSFRPLLPWDLRNGLGAQLTSSPLAAAAAVVVVALALRSLWTQGARGWFSPLRHRPE